MNDTSNAYPRVILCNTTIQVMGLINWQKGISLILSGKAHSIKDSDSVVRSPSLEIAVPEIIVLNQYADAAGMFEIKDTDYASLGAIRKRDNYTCAYCGEYGYTVDHIIPKCREGSSRWDNLITACSKCNSKKDDKLLSELGWELLFEPRPIKLSSLYKEHQKKVYEALEELSA